MDHFGGSPLGPLLRLIYPALLKHRERREENETWRQFDEASAKALAALGFLHAGDLAREAFEAEGPRAHWASLSQFFEEAGATSGDLAFSISLAEQAAAIDLWRELQGEEVSFVEAGEVLAFASGEGPAGVGRLDQSFLLGFSSLVINGARASHFLVRAEAEGEPVLVAFSRDDAVESAELAPTLPGFWSGSVGELALHGAEVLPHDIKLRGSLVQVAQEAHDSLARLLRLSALAGVLKNCGEGTAPLLPLRLSLSGLLELARQAVYGEETASIRPVLDAAEGSLVRDLGAALESAPGFTAAKLARDLKALQVLFPTLGSAAATSKPASQAG